MGCDVHMFSEKLNKQTNKWEFIENEYICDYSLWKISDYMSNNLGLDKDECEDIFIRYIRNEEPKNKLEESIFNKFLKGLIHDDPNVHWGDETKLPYPFSSNPYSGRNYSLFGALAGVRDCSMELIVEADRGLPEDVCDEIREEADGWDMDGHSYNYIYLKEIIESSYYKQTDEELDEYGLIPFFRHTVNELMRLGDPEEIRIVFWFDN